MDFLLGKIKERGGVVDKSSGRRKGKKRRKENRYIGKTQS